MRRIALWFASTVAVLMLLAGYHTSFAGPLAVTAVLVATASVLYVRSRLQPVSAHNVNDDWEDADRGARSSDPQEAVA